VALFARYFSHIVACWNISAWRETLVETMTYEIHNVLSAFVNERSFSRNIDNEICRLNSLACDFLWVLRICFLLCVLPKHMDDKILCGTFRTLALRQCGLLEYISMARNISRSKGLQDL
jgi:hypothetical protein